MQQSEHFLLFSVSGLHVKLKIFLRLSGFSILYVIITIKSKLTDLNIYND